jgi:hypothetical protein
MLSVFVELIRNQQQQLLSEEIVADFHHLRIDAVCRMSLKFFGIEFQIADSFLISSTLFPCNSESMTEVHFGRSDKRNVGFKCFFYLFIADLVAEKRLEKRSLLN